ncbi:MAG TPA: META domain-containing protein, partial [Candidatus Limnocylindrales bacterium]|nr:META domain-containing protein [Candidatus Limnocylindrales bacterium]
ADCNNVAGTYDTDDPAASAGRLTITPGPTTLVACPEGSLGDLFVIGLSKAFSYSIENDALTIVTRDLGTLTFK